MPTYQIGEFGLDGRHPRAGPGKIVAIDPDGSIHLKMPDNTSRRISPKDFWPQTFNR